MNKDIKKLIITILCVMGSLNAASISPIPQKVIFDEQKAILGAKLFHDKRLSKDNSVSCASCHNLNQGGVDNLSVSIGIGNKKGDINTPTVLNSVFNFRQFWDGRAANLQQQALGPLLNPHEMGNDTIFKLIDKLKQTEYNEAFNNIYKNGLTKTNLLDTIVEFEKILITPNSRFDRFLNKEEDILTKKEKKGFELFKSKGCISCHNGVNIGGNLYSKFGVMKDAKSSNLGRFNVTNKEKDKYYFKVPSLRNIEHTAPYFHDARTSSLKEAVEIMSLYQLGRPISNNEIDNIVAFLKTLSAKIPKEYSHVLKEK
ncbi:MAG: cytochrome-c peroxidase [Campylobacterota bacterium]